MAPFYMKVRAQYTKPVIFRLTLGSFCFTEQDLAEKEAIRGKRDVTYQRRIGEAGSKGSLMAT